MSWRRDFFVWLNVRVQWALEMLPFLGPIFRRRREARTRAFFAQYPGADRIVEHFAKGGSRALEDAIEALED